MDYFLKKKIFSFSDGFASFREAFPEWCEDESVTASENAKSLGTNHSESLMGLRYVFIVSTYT